MTLALFPKTVDPKMVGLHRSSVCLYDKASAWPYEQLDGTYGEQLEPCLREAELPDDGVHSEHEDEAGRQASQDKVLHDIAHETSLVAADTRELEEVAAEHHGEAVPLSCRDNGDGKLLEAGQTY